MTYIILLRGVMPKGKNSIPKMAFLKDILEKAGFEKVRTYIQSGNIVLKTELSPLEISATTRNKNTISKLLAMAREEF